MSRPILGADHVRSADVRVEARAVGEPSPVWGPVPLEHLGSHERQRYATLRRTGDRAAYLEAHLLVREVAADLLGCDAKELIVRQSCPGCGGRGHGAPEILGAPDIGVSWSHTEDHVAAIAVRGKACGIDAEWAPPPAELRVPKGALTSDEVAWVRRQDDPSIAFARIWTRKESLVKCGVMPLDSVVRTSLLTGEKLGLRCHGAHFHELATPRNLDDRLVVSWAVRAPGASPVTDASPAAPGP